jgi:hypothetical protein
MWNGFAENILEYWKDLPPFDEELRANFRKQPVEIPS